jgi:hypothetical protein
LAHPENERREGIPTGGLSFFRPFFQPMTAKIQMRFP